MIVQAEKGLPGKEPAVVCLGFFDGVHLGHQQLVRRALEVARPLGYLVCVHTFAHMPAKVIRPDLEILELTPLEEKAALLTRLGADYVAVSPFDQAMMHMSARDFFYDILVGKLRAATIVAGFHHRFGFKGEAGTAELVALCQEAGMGAEIISPVRSPMGELVSSTAIRNLLAAGEYSAAETMLGRPIDMEKHGRSST